MTFVGASLALKKNEHFAIEFAVEKLPGRAAGIATRISQLLVVVFSLLLIGFGGVQMWHGWNTVTPVLEIPRSVPYAAVPFGGVLMLVRSLEALLRPLPAIDSVEEATS
jgi:TRAP-type C4-dicarboxylate transport system permease small subunit